MCCQHYYIYRITKEPIKDGDIQSGETTPIKTPDEIERRKRFELRFIREQEDMAEEALYREYRKMKLQNLI